MTNNQKILKGLELILKNPIYIDSDKEIISVDQTKVSKQYKDLTENEWIMILDSILKLDGPKNMNPSPSQFDNVCFSKRDLISYKENLKEKICDQKLDTSLKKSSKGFANISWIKIIIYGLIFLGGVIISKLLG